MKEMGKEIDRLSNELTRQRWEFWHMYTLFSWQWWSLVALCLLCVVALVLLLKRDKLVQAAAYYGVIYLINKNVDDWATAMDWYDYRMQLEPIIPTMLPANLFAIPTILTLLYYRLPGWKGFALALAAASAVISYIMLPFMEWAQIYVTGKWNAHSSFISLFIMGSLAKWVVDMLQKLQDRPQGRVRP
ncbi:hypothetical protein [Paenibacillus tarimensis]|uniref:hypothetical protein n=1 Tax=Paenibacillus tarimensis TaxID=416012 RepID=UPI001F364FD5|nr:hypothetical protein [Paenibacillus tarimensis]MCF2946271.1 hypothetical protein [Paenibacillus tarimensis]